MRLSASSAHRVELCPPSAVLPHVQHESAAADSGSALHEHMELRVKLGVDGAVEALDETFARWNVSAKESSFLRKRLLSFEWTPPAGSLTEIRLAIMPDYTVRQVPRDKRFYPGALFTGASDIIWAQPKPLTVTDEGVVVCPAESVLWVVDLKGGTDAWVPSIESNFQAAINAFTAARWLKAKRVVPAIVFPGEGHGEWDAPKRPWGPKEIDAVESRIRTMLANVERAQVHLDRGGAELELKEGRHCEYCPAMNVCPAKVALFKRVLSDDDRIVPGFVGGLEKDQAVQLARMLGQLEGFSRRARTCLENYVRANGPISIGDGLFWGPVKKKKTRINRKIAREVLAEELGEAGEVAFEVSGASIERAVEEVAPHGAVSARVKRIYAKIGERGGITHEMTTENRVHRQKEDSGESGTPQTPVVDVVGLREQLEASVVAANEAQAAGEAPIVRFRSGRRRCR